MVQIVRPQGGSQQSNAGISLGTAGRVGAGLASIGQEVTAAGRRFQSNSNQAALSRQVGQMVSAQGKEYFERSKRAHQTGLLANSMSNATMEFTKRQQERTAQITDKDGNPNFMSLPDDIGNIGKEVSEDVLSKIIDPEVRQRFKSNFSSYISNQQILALKQARKQQISYSRESLEKGLKSLMTQGQQDDLDNIASYEGQARELLDDAALGGVISEDEYVKKTAEFNEGTRAGALERLIQTDPVSAQSVMTNTPQALGVTEGTKQLLDEQLDAKIRSDEIQLLKAQGQAEREARNSQAVLAEDLERRMEADSLREDELLRYKGSFDDATFKKLTKKFVRESEKAAKKNAELNTISLAISQGQSADEFKPALLDEHYDRLVEARTDLQEAPVTLAQKAEIAAAYKTKIRSFSKEVNNSLLFGDPNQAAQAVSAYTYIRDRESRALEGNTFTSKAEAIAEYAELLNERAGLGINEAVIAAKDRVLSTTDELRKERSKDFRKMSAFKLDSYKETAADDLGAENFLGFNKEITDDAAQTYKTLVESAYLETGDESAARKIAQSQMNKTHGLTGLNGDDSYMFAPPEKLYPGVDVDLMRRQLETDLVPVLPAGISSSQVKIFSDDITRGNFITATDKTTGETKRIELTSYGVQYEKVIDKSIFGDTTVTVPLVNPNTGELVRWFPDVNAIQEGARTEALQEAQRQDAALRSVEISTRSGVTSEQAFDLAEPSKQVIENNKSVLLNAWNPEQDTQGLDAFERNLLDDLNTKGQNLNTKQKTYLADNAFADQGSSTQEVKDALLNMWNPEQDEQGLDSFEKQLLTDLTTTDKALTEKQKVYLVDYFLENNR